MRPPCLIALCLSLWGAVPAGADRGRPTPLLEENLQTGKRVRIDASSQYLDAEFDRVLGPDSGFSTRELERVLDRLRGELRRERPRATPKLVVFLYPGATDVARLQGLPQIFVDIELVLDPCERTVCTDAIAKHIEMVGRAVGQPVLASGGHRFVFQVLILSSVLATQQGEAQLQKVPIADCITAAARRQGGQAWLDARQHAEDDYEPLCVKAIARQAALRRVPLTAPPRVSRDAEGVHVLMRARGERNRIESDVIGALGVAMAGLRQSPATPKEVQLEVELAVSMGRAVVRRFRAEGGPVGQYLDGRLDAGALWKSYISETTRRKDVTRLDFGSEP